MSTHANIKTKWKNPFICSTRNEKFAFRIDDKKIDHPKVGQLFSVNFGTALLSDYVIVFIHYIQNFIFHNPFSSPILRQPKI